MPILLLNRAPPVDRSFEKHGDLLRFYSEGKNCMAKMRCYECGRVTTIKSLISKLIRSSLYVCYSSCLCDVMMGNQVTLISEIQLQIQQYHHHIIYDMCRYVECMSDMLSIYIATIVSEFHLFPHFYCCCIYSIHTASQHGNRILMHSSRRMIEGGKRRKETERDMDTTHQLN